MYSLLIKTRKINDDLNLTHCLWLALSVYQNIGCVDFRSTAQNESNILNIIRIPKIVYHDKVTVSITYCMARVNKKEEKSEESKMN